MIIFGFILKKSNKTNHLKLMVMVDRPRGQHPNRRPSVEPLRLVSGEKVRETGTVEPGSGLLQVPQTVELQLVR